MAVGLPRLRSCLAIAIALCVYTQGAGLRVAAVQDPQPQPSFRTSTTVVEVDVIVRDGRRQFVSGLTPADFEILEDGVPQAIRTLYVVQGRRLQAGSAIQTFSVVQGQRPQAAPPAGIEQPDTAAPPSIPASAPQRVFVLVFDQAHLSQNSFKRLQPAAETFLRKEFQLGDVGGVLMGGTMVGNRLVTDREALVTAVKGAKLSADLTAFQRDLGQWPRMSEAEAIRIAIANDTRILQQVTDRALRETAEPGGGRGAGGFDAEGLVREKARVATTQMQASAAQTLRSLQALVNGLGRIPGRKTVVLMTEGFMLEEAGAALRQIVGLAARSNVRIYTLDALGLRRKDTVTDLSQMNPLETGGQVPTGAYQTLEEGPNTLAVDTGGYVIRNTNDFAAALGEISSDTSNYYVIGYTPTNAKLDGSFRRIAVRVKRPGVEVRARRGYLALPVAVPSGGAPPAAPVSTPAVETPSGAPARAESKPVEAPAVGTAATATAASAGTEWSLGSLLIRPDTGTRVRALESLAPDVAAGKDRASEGWERYRKGDLEGAEQLLGEAAAQPRAAPWVHYALGFAHYGLRKPAEAVASWERVRSAVPEFTDVYLDLADAYMTQDDAGHAVGVLREAEKRWPANADVLNALGTIQVRRGALNDAIETFGRAVERQPKDALAYFNLGRTHELRYYQMRRFSRPGARWIDNPEELKKAAEYYEAYLKIGGPYEEEARAGLARVRFK